MRIAPAFEEDDVGIMRGKRALAPGERVRVPIVNRRAKRALTHMWNGPIGKVFLQALPHAGRCGHMSGL